MVHGGGLLSVGHLPPYIEEILQLLPGDRQSITVYFCHTDKLTIFALLCYFCTSITCRGCTPETENSLAN